MVPLSNNPDIIGGSNRNPNHRAPNQQLTIGWLDSPLKIKILANAIPNAQGDWKKNTPTFTSTPRCCRDQHTYTPGWVFENAENLIDPAILGAPNPF